MPLDDVIAASTVSAAVHSLISHCAGTDPAVEASISRAMACDVQNALHIGRNPGRNRINAKALVLVALG